MKHADCDRSSWTRTAAKAEVVLPAAAFAEADGTLVNNEGRAQRFYQVLFQQARSGELALAQGHHDRTGRARSSDWEGLDDVIKCSGCCNAGIQRGPDIAPPAGFRIAGMKIPRKPHRYSGRTAMFADKTVFEPKPPKDPDSPLAFTMEGYPGQPPSALIPRFWAPGWNSPQAMNKFQTEVGGPLRGGDPGRRLIEPATSRSTLLLSKRSLLRLHPAGIHGCSFRLFTYSVLKN